MAITPRLGVCYYPEQWPEEWWQEDARRMAQLGLTFVRIGEFAWSRIEPQPGKLDLTWLKRAIDILHAAGLKVVLGTPTATPPKWLVDQMPDMLPVGADGKTRGFGSRRHYCFSHEAYRAECKRIVTELATAFGRHPGLAAWQTDNEYDCHNTTLSYSNAALAGFRNWLARKYQSPDALNRAWGNVFWSMEYRSFEEIELPNGTVTEANPAHWMDFRRYSSDQVVAFNRLQTDIIRTLSPGRDIIHNFMGRTLAFDHFDVGADLDISSWDSYPLGFLEDRSGRSDEFKARYYRAGDPDLQGLHHDLYRATSGGRWWVMEQQPGPVNWAPYNPAPRDGMVRLWTWEAFAHGAEVVSYFRWRQAPFAQEQMHAGLLRPDSAEAPAYIEAAAVMAELGTVGPVKPRRADVALVFDYPSAWAIEIQPQGRDMDYFMLMSEHYRALRSLGLDVDITPATNPDLEGRKLVLIPGLFTWNETLIEAIRKTGAQVLIGLRSGSKTENFSIPSHLPPNLPSDVLDAKVMRVESLSRVASVRFANTSGAFTKWREYVECGSKSVVSIASQDGEPAVIRQNHISYVAGWPDEAGMLSILAMVAKAAKLPVLQMPEGVRTRHIEGGIIAWNYSEQTIDLVPLLGVGDYHLDGPVLKPSGVAFLKKQAK